MFKSLIDLPFLGTKMKAYKIQDVDRKSRIGITAKSFDEVLEKGRLKLNIPKGVEITVALEDDGTIIDSDDFLNILPSQTALVFLRKGETWSGVGGLIYQALSGISNTADKSEVAEQIRELLTGETSPEKISVMSQYLDMLETDIDSEDRYENEDWFDGLNKKFRTKKEVMRNTAQQRIRSYYTNAKESIEKEKDLKVKALLTELMDEMFNKLKKNDFHGHYFDRSAPAKHRICDKNGWFKCEGAFDEKECSKLHTINPYASKGYRQLFGLWNLDHIVEKSREVIPSLLQAARKKPKSKQLNCDEVYKLLFTRSNLKLVQIACHKKAARILNTVKLENFYFS